MLSVDFRLWLIVGLRADGPGKVFRISPLGCAFCDGELGHLALVHVLMDRRVWRGTKRVE